jgi:hypothetical protein
MRNENNAGVDLDRLEQLARAATRGPWGYRENDPFRVRGDEVRRVYIADTETQPDARFIAAANPSTILALIDLARRASASQISKDAGGVSVEQVPELPKSNDGKEQDAFEAWAGSERYDMATHPIHWLFLNERTDAARQGWKAALEYIGKVMSAGAAAKTEQPGHETIVNEGGNLVCTACGTSASAAGAVSEQQGAALTDDHIIAALHSQGIDTYPSKYGFDAVQVSATSIPNLRTVIEKCAGLARAPLPEQDDDARDAARYRWLCENNFDRQGVPQVHTHHHWWEPHSETGLPQEWSQRVRGERLDAVIDAAMSASRPDDKPCE